MFVRNEGKYCRLFNVPFRSGEVREVTEDELAQLTSLVDCGHFSVHTEDPNKEVVVKKPRTRRRRKTTTPTEE